jgi:hypothetical protein
MFGRYRRLVPREHRDLIRRHRLPKPNWFVGSAEGRRLGDVRMDVAMLREIARVKAEIDARVSGEPGQVKESE